MSEHVTSGTDARVLRSCGRSEHARTHAAAAAHAAKLRVSSHSATPSPPTPAPRSPHQNRHLWIRYLSYGTGPTRPGFPLLHGGAKINSKNIPRLCCVVLCARSPCAAPPQFSSKRRLIGRLFFLNVCDDASYFTHKRADRGAQTLWRCRFVTARHCVRIAHCFPPLLPCLQPCVKKL